MLFSQIIAQQKVKERLITSVKEERISHAQLFSGREGAGALPLAMAYAQYINCENRSETDSCGKCNACIKIQKLIHPDLHFSYPVANVKKEVKQPSSLDFISEWREALLENPYLGVNEWIRAIVGDENKQLFISVEESADIIHKLSLKTFESPFKILIMWLPEKMRTDAANKLLKIIEEPPGKTVFIFVSENHDQLPATILSRLQFIKINRPSDNDIRNALVNRSGISVQEAKRIVHLADGNYNLAQSLAKNEIGEVELEQEFLEWMRICFNPFKDVKVMTAWVDKKAKEGRENQKNFLSFCLEASRECLVSNYGNREQLRFDEEAFPGFQKFSAFVTRYNIEEFSEALNKAHYHIERNANPKILFLDLCLKMHSILHKKQDFRNEGLIIKD